MPDPATGARTVGDIINDLPVDASDNPRAVVGDNGAPEPTPFEAVKIEIDDLYAEAKGWLDGEPLATEGQAAEVGELRKRIQAAEKRAEALRVAEKKPHDDAAKAVQERFNPLIQKDKGKTSLALSAINKALAPYLAELDRQQRAAARAAHEAAEKAAREAREASQRAAESANLAEREEAERLQKEAKAAQKDARAAETTKAQVHATGGGRAIGMKTNYIPELVDPAAAIAHYRQAQPAALKAFMLDQAVKDIRAGPKPPAAIPGFAIREERVPV